MVWEWVSLEASHHKFGPQHFVGNLDFRSENLSFSTFLKVCERFWSEISVDFCLLGNCTHHSFARKPWETVSQKIERLRNRSKRPAPAAYSKGLTCRWNAMVMQSQTIAASHPFAVRLFVISLSTIANDSGMVLHCSCTTDHIQFIHYPLPSTNRC